MGAATQDIHEGWREGPQPRRRRHQLQDVHQFRPVCPNAMMA